MQQLLDAGADVDSHDNHDRAALVAATASGHDSVVLLLLGHKADINARRAYRGHLCMLQHSMAIFLLFVF